MKLIFLDIDGVMKPVRCYLHPSFGKEWLGGWDPIAVAIINRLCEHTQAKIVFNTTWNRENIECIAREQGILEEHIAGKTKYPYYTSRLVAIQDYLNEVPTNTWVALDDAIIDHELAIRIDPHDGIKFGNYLKAADLLGAPDERIFLI